MRALRSKLVEYQSFLYCVYIVEALNFEHGVYLIVHVKRE